MYIYIYIYISYTHTHIRSGPALQMSTAAVYSIDVRTTSGARYQRVPTYLGRLTIINTIMINTTILVIVIVVVVIKDIRLIIIIIHRCQDDFRRSVPASAYVPGRGGRDFGLPESILPEFSVNLVS